MMIDNLKIWETIFQNHEWGKYPAISVVRFIARNYYKVKKENRKDIIIMEIGSGTGANLWFCAREGFSVIALEGSKTALERMINRFDEENLLCYLVSAKSGNYYATLNEIDNNSIDAIIDCESLYCNSFNVSREIIINCFEKLKIGGKMISITFADGTWGMTGPEIDYHAVFPEVGPLAGKGFSRFTTYDDIEILYKLENNVIEKIERQEYYYSENEVVKEWIIELRKL